MNYYPVFNLETKKYELVLNKPKYWVSEKDVSKLAKWAIIVSEDWAFFDHDGFDINQIQIVVGESIKAGHFVRGASTITQQVIKNSVLTSERSLWRKFRELVLSYKIEYYFSKEKILEIYLNIIELGENIYGIGQASEYYFQKKPSELNAREGAFLAMLLPSPVKYSSSYNNKKLSPFALEQIESILVKLRQAKMYTEEDRLEVVNKKFIWEKQAEIEVILEPVMSDEELMDEDYFYE